MSSDIVYENDDIFTYFYDQDPHAKVNCNYENVINYKKNKKQLPVNKVSNLINLLNRNEIIKYISDTAGADTKAIYWTDLLRKPIEILYHCYFNEETQDWNYVQYEIINNEIVNHQFVDYTIIELERSKYINIEIITSEIIPKFTDSNILHLQCAWMDISIRKIDDDKYVVAEAHYCGDNKAFNKVIRY